jgi:hypothetical protein
MLTRRHKGRDIVVQVLDEGFEYESRHYGSLSWTRGRLGRVFTPSIYKEADG